MSIEACEHILIVTNNIQTDVINEYTADNGILVENVLHKDGAITINSTINSINTTTGSLIVSGGAGIAQDLYIGNDLIVTNELTLGSGSPYSFPTSAGLNGQILILNTSNALVFSTPDSFPTAVLAPTEFGTDNRLVRSIGTSGRDVEATGISITDNDGIDGVDSLTIIGTASSTSNTSGALIVCGGVGIKENINIGGDINVDGDLNVSGTTNFDTVTFSGITSITDTTQSDNCTTGALIVAGGVGIGKNLNVCENLDVVGASTITTLNASGTSTFSSTVAVTDTTQSDNCTTGALTVAGGVGIAKNLNVCENLDIDGATTLNTLNASGDTTFGSTVYLSSTAVSNDGSSGALIVEGGVGIGGDLNVDGDLTISGNTTFDAVTFTGITSITDTTQSDNCTTGALIVSGGVGIAKNLNVCENLDVDGTTSLDETTISGVTNITNTTESNNCTTGALVVYGGAGIGKNLNVCGDLDVAGNITGNISTGSPGSGSISYLGEGDSYTDTMVVLSNSNDEAGTWVNNTVAAASESGSTFSIFQGTGVNNACYIGSDFIFSGVYLDITTALASTEATNLDYEYWNGSAWIAFTQMSTEIVAPYDSYAKNGLEQAIIQEFRIGLKTTEYALKTLDGNSKYWIRFLVNSTITTIPVIEQVKVHTNRLQVDSNGFMQYFGLSRPVTNLPWGIGLLHPFGTNSPDDSVLYVSDKLGSGAVENLFSASVIDRSGFHVVLPGNMDTSFPLKFNIKYMIFSAGSGDITLVVRWGYTSNADNIYVSGAGRPTVGPNEQSVTKNITMTSKAINTQFDESFTLDISELNTRNIGSDKDILWVVIERTGSAGSDTFSEKLVVVQINASYVKWCEGGYISDYVTN